MYDFITYKRLNFGISSASEVFQEAIRSVIQHMYEANNIYKTTKSCLAKLKKSMIEHKNKHFRLSEKPDLHCIKMSVQSEEDITLCSSIRLGRILPRSREGQSQSKKQNQPKQ